jgi:hypothetical protein
VVMEKATSLGDLEGELLHAPAHLLPVHSGVDTMLS